MSKLVWDQVGARLYETGVDRGVLYPYDTENHTYGEGVAWNGLTAVNESPSGAEASPIYADNIKYLELRSLEEFGGTIEAYTYPDEFGAMDGYGDLADGVIVTQQKRGMFGFCYRTLIGNDVDENDHGYKIHLVYGARVSPSERSHSTVNESPEAETMSWTFTTTPVSVEDMKPTAHIIIDSTKFTTTEAKAKLTAFEEILYGRDADQAQSITALSPSLPLPDEVKDHFD